MPSHTLPAVAGDKDRSLQEAVGRLSLSRGPGGFDSDPIVTTTRRLPAVPPSFAAFPAETDERLDEGARRAGHRAALHPSGGRVRARPRPDATSSPITPTASGKTLCYNAPVLDAILKDPSTRALYLFPTKALAQDQLAELHALVQLAEEHGAPEVGVFTYDGDTPSDARRAIRGKAHVVLSNPDMLHSGILPHHPRWAKLFENLKFVVIDELHAYRGVFGSHLSNILRRLRRVCRHYGSDPVFICSSATIANPRELAEGLTGRAVRADRRERRAARREVLPVRESAGRERRARHPALVSGGSAPRCARVPQAQPSTDPLRAEPAGDRDPDHLLEGCVPRRAGIAPTSSAAIAAAICPAGAARSNAGSAKDRFAPSSRRTRWSWASTSARSTCR